jgi:outer membrane protein TolC
VPDFIFPRLLAGFAVIGLALSSAGCAASGEGPRGLGQGLASSAAGREQVGDPEPLWWETAGDPVLARLIDRGLAANTELICDAMGLQAKEREADAASRRLGSRIQSLFGAGDQLAEAGASQARAYRHADRRARVAAEIAAAYIEARRLQETRAARAKLLEQFKDNADIAKFRREAGLAPGLDSGLAGSLVSVTKSDLDAAGEQIETQVHELARLTGMEPQEVRAAIGGQGHVPDIAADVSGENRLSLARRADLLALESSLLTDMTRAGVTQEDLDAVLAGDAADAPERAHAAAAARSLARYREEQARAYEDIQRRRQAVAAASARQAELEDAIRDARSTVGDARLAYRNGTGDFATLYVAEAADLALHEARIRARAALAVATVNLWTAEGGGWTAADLAPHPAGAGVVPELTVCE